VSGEALVSILQQQQHLRVQELAHGDVQVREGEGGHRQLVVWLCARVWGGGSARPGGHKVFWGEGAGVGTD
jgi:hypothetical protein